ncbi:hypothetical protein P280DRAFT_256967 [Massarina eburnea CBS 473.64]|uniref:Secreted protein n=1 Tax=Massarina eburnea CBS 473.64 TaxID=1395130 RepID=A0A6A6S7H2_9PLEO|nr:hypothetical protein P280DRAFT_256967 [Massarina eburnea CBS 473.64]
MAFGLLIGGLATLLRVFLLSDRRNLGRGIRCRVGGRKTSELLLSGFGIGSFDRILRECVVILYCRVVGGKH